MAKGSVRIFALVRILLNVESEVLLNLLQNARPFVLVYREEASQPWPPRGKKSASILAMGPQNGDDGGQ